MPYLRFARDKRGYETTSLLNASRQHGRPHPKLIYYFRSPVGVKVGRAPLDEDAIRLIEDHHPDLIFDWQKMLQVSRGAESEQAEERSVQQPSTARPPDAEGGPKRNRRRRPRPQSSEESSDLPSPGSRKTAAEEEFSPEDLSRLRGRYAVVVARIDQHAADPDRCQQLRQMAEALNPDTWVTKEEVKEALEHYERVYRELQEALARRSAPPDEPASAVTEPSFARTEPDELRREGPASASDEHADEATEDE